jgi:hypothetical protein
VFFYAKAQHLLYCKDLLHKRPCLSSKQGKGLAAQNLCVFLCERPLGELAAQNTNGFFMLRPFTNLHLLHKTWVFFYVSLFIKLAAQNTAFFYVRFFFEHLLHKTLLVFLCEVGIQTCKDSPFFM